MRKVALITGINGQDGSYLAEFLLKKDYDVHGIIRRTSQFNRSRIENTRELATKRGHIFNLVYGEQSSPNSFNKIIHKYKPTEIYNLASQSHVGISFEEPEYSTEVNANSVLRLLESMRHFNKDCRLFQASSSEIFGDIDTSPQTEETIFNPVSPYGVAKAYAFWILKTYRKAYNMHVNNGIMYNHESPRRGENFVTRKITYSLARIKYGLQDTLELGNIDMKRDWGFSGDYVEAMWLMLQNETPDDFIIATGQTHTVREFVELSASISGFNIKWEGSGADEIGIDEKTGKIIVKINSKFYRPVDSKDLCGNTEKIQKTLGWSPKVTFNDLVKIMTEADLKAVKESI